MKKPGGKISRKKQYKTAAKGSQKKGVRKVVVESQIPWMGGDMNN